MNEEKTNLETGLTTAEVEQKLQLEKSTKLLTINLKQISKLFVKMFLPTLT